MSSTTTFSRGNPRVPPPAGAKSTLASTRKRLIVLCDGTCEDSLASSAQYPTNITRLARAMSPNAWIPNGPDGNYEEIEQIIFYQAGPGTFYGNFLLGATFGTGLSELVRAAYGFLANNYNEGDKICIFGFSRGAYIARSIAGLVAEYGLLTKRGMDNFLPVYTACYNSDKPGGKISAGGKSYSPDELGLRPLPRGTVEVVGVFDTVAFHNPFTIWLDHLFNVKLPFLGGDKDEFPNTRLSDNIKYAFHGLSLDESRRPFQTTLWFQPKVPSAEETQAIAKDGWRTTLKQVWFSGVHLDVGGAEDSRLSNIPFAWMISELVHHELVEFDQNYLLDYTDPHEDKWDTAKGPVKVRWRDAPFTVTANSVVGIVQKVLAWTFRNLFQAKTLARKISGMRTPGTYIPLKDFGKNDDPDKFDTHEWIHTSIADRRLTYTGPGSEYSVLWPCQPLNGALHCKFRDDVWSWVITWQKKKHSLPQTISSDIETFFRGRIRNPLLLAPITQDEDFVKPVTSPPIESWL